MVTLNKKLAVIIFITVIIGNLTALDTRSYRFIDLLLSLRAPAAPAVFDGAVIFTAGGAPNRAVGVAFAHERFERVHRLKKILVPLDQTEPFDPKAKTEPERLRDSGILFLAYEPPPGLDSLEYRMVIDGLWGPDPANPSRYVDARTGICLNLAPLPPPAEVRRLPPPGDPGLSVRFRAPPGGRVSAAGDFNAWDPFMYPLAETRPGDYRLDLPLPPGEYRYALYHNGERVLDPANTNKAYTPDGKVVNVLRVE